MLNQVKEIHQSFKRKRDHPKDQKKRAIIQKKDHISTVSARSPIQSGNRSKKYKEFFHHRGLHFYAREQH